MMKRLFLKIFIVTAFCTGVLFPLGLMAQEGGYTVRIKQPVGDTIKKCPGEKIIFLAEGLNDDGSSFDPNQVVFTWDLGYEGKMETGPTVNFTYPVGGHYLIRLYVTGLDGPSAKNIPELHAFIGIRPSFSGTRSDQASICSGSEITLTGFATPVPWNGDNYPFINSHGDFIWSGAGIQSNRNGIARVKPPLDKSHQKYLFTVTDDFGCYHDTTITVYGVYADFDMEPKTGEAPLEVTFTVDSASNGGMESSITYEWEFYENTDTSTLVKSYLDQDTYTFEIPGEYTCRMIAKYLQCTYVYTHDEYIRVDSSLLEIPNVFTPNEDGANDYFQVKCLSLKTFHGIIYNRWGRAVFEWTDPKTLESGWNGKYMNTGTNCPDGTYFYVIKATGYDKDKYAEKDEETDPDPDILYEGGVYKGFLTLIR